MSLQGFLIGIVAFIFCLGLAQAVPLIFTSLSVQILDLLKLAFLILGGFAIFIGAMDK